MKIKNHYKEYFTASEQPEIIYIEKASYLSILGSGTPGTDIFYQKKRAVKQVSDLLMQNFEGTANAFQNDVIEIFYWFDEQQVGHVDIGHFYTSVDLSLLHYRIAIRLPDRVSALHVNTFLGKDGSIAFAHDMEFFSYEAGQSVQILHKGPFAGELETLPVLQEFANKNGLKKHGMHHEIHLTPFEKGQSQENLLTILRDPVI